MVIQGGHIPFNKGKKKQEWEKAKMYSKICPECGNKFSTKRDTQIYCNQKCYAKSYKLKNDARKSLLIKYNSVARWREGTGGKKFVTSTSFKKGDKRLMGINNPRWNKDKNFMKLSRQIRQTQKYLEWKRKILGKNKGKGKNLHVHHIKPFNQILIENKITSIGEAEKCKELWNLNNGICLTKGEHNIISKMERFNEFTEGFISELIKCLNEKSKKRGEIVYKEFKTNG